MFRKCVVGMWNVPLIHFKRKVVELVDLAMSMLIKNKKYSRYVRLFRPSALCRERFTACLKDCCGRSSAYWPCELFSHCDLRSWTEVCFETERLGEVVQVWLEVFGVDMCLCLACPLQITDFMQRTCDLLSAVRQRWRPTSLVMPGCF